MSTRKAPVLLSHGKLLLFLLGGAHLSTAFEALHHVTALGMLDTLGDPCFCRHTMLHHRAVHPQSQEEIMEGPRAYAIYDSRLEGSLDENQP